MIVDIQINLCPLPQKRPSPSIAAVRVAKSVSFVVTLMAVFLLAPASRAQEHAPTATMALAMWRIGQAYSNRRIAPNGKSPTR